MTCVFVSSVVCTSGSPVADLLAHSSQLRRHYRVFHVLPEVYPAIMHKVLMKNILFSNRECGRAYGLHPQAPHLRQLLAVRVQLYPFQQNLIYL